jgi:hypothetical protein
LLELTTRDGQRHGDICRLPGTHQRFSSKSVTPGRPDDPSTGRPLYQARRLPLTIPPPQNLFIHACGNVTDKEVAIPAYEAMLGNSRLGRRMLEILLHGVSTRNYRKVLPQMAETVAVSKSNLSREFVEASEQTLKDLWERRFEGQNMLIVYLDGIQFGLIHVIVALGVDAQGYKHVLGLREGSSENATGVKDLLTDIVSRGLDPGR